MTGSGVYYTGDGGMFDASAGLYYPDLNNKENFFEAHFDGRNLRFKKSQQTQKLKQIY